MDWHLVIFLEIATFMSNYDQQTQNEQLLISEWPILHEWPIYMMTNALVIMYNWSLVIVSWSYMTNALFINDQLLLIDDQRVGHKWPTVAVAIASFHDHYLKSLFGHKSHIFQCIRVQFIVW